MLNSLGPLCEPHAHQPWALCSTVWQAAIASGAAATAVQAAAIDAIDALGAQVPTLGLQPRTSHRLLASPRSPPSPLAHQSRLRAPPVGSSWACRTRRVLSSRQLWPSSASARRNSTRPLRRVTSLRRPRPRSSRLWARRRRPPARPRPTNWPGELYPSLSLSLPLPLAPSRSLPLPPSPSLSHSLSFPCDASATGRPSFALTPALPSRLLSPHSFSPLTPSLPSLNATASAAATATCGALGEALAKGEAAAKSLERRAASLATDASSAARAQSVAWSDLAAAEEVARSYARSDSNP